MYGGGGTSTALGLRPRGLDADLGASDTLLAGAVGLNLIVGRDEVEGPSAGDGTGAAATGGGSMVLADALEASSAATAAKCEALFAASNVLLIRDQSVVKQSALITRTCEKQTAYVSQKEFRLRWPRCVRNCRVRCTASHC